MATDDMRDGEQGSAVPPARGGKRPGSHARARKGPRTHDALLRPLTSSGKKFYAVAAVLLAVITWGIYAYTLQLRRGLAVTGMNDVVSWGFYIANFVFFIGISHVGAMMSAILRLTGAGWRAPLTRMAEAITFCSLFVAGLMPLLDMGRPDRILHLVLYGRLQSPVIWDLISISTYLAGSTIFLLLPMIPDIALLRDTLTGVSKARTWLYRTLSFGWTGSDRQKARLHRGMALMTVIIIPIAVSVHTVVSWIFGMTLRPGWHSTIFGPYFVVGALFSGIATVIMAMALFRHVYHLEEYITLKHFNNLGLLLLVFDVIYMYFTLNEYLTMAYKMEGWDALLLGSLLQGKYAALFWGVLVFGLLIPAVLLAFRKTRTIWGTSVAAALITVGMWVKRYVITIPSLAVPRLPYDWGLYSPTWVEWSILAASFAGFLLLYVSFSKIFPIVSIWEVEEEEKSGKDDSRTRPSSLGLRHS